MTFEREVVIRALVRSHIEQAMAEAARLPERGGQQVIALLTDALVATDGRIAEPECAGCRMELPVEETILGRRHVRSVIPGFAQATFACTAAKAKPIRKFALVRCERRTDEEYQAAHDDGPEAA